MKKFAILVLAAMLLLGSVAAHADEIAIAKDGVFTYPGVFQLEYPDHWGFVSSEDSENNTDTFTSIGIITDPSPTGLVVDMWIRYLEDWADFSLFDATEEEMEEYISLTLGDYEEDLAIYRETVYTDEYNIPFIVLVGFDSYGLYVHAETMASGWMICFDLYAYTDSTYETCRDLTEEEYAQFCEIIKSFMPQM